MEDSIDAARIENEFVRMIPDMHSNFKPAV
jgi:hypothetical protein